MKILSLAGIFIYLLSFEAPMNNAVRTQLFTYYRKKNIVIEVRSADYFGNLSLEKNDRVGEIWEQLRNMHNTLLLSGWNNI